jgi:hypothetical protein
MPWPGVQATYVDGLLSTRFFFSFVRRASKIMTSASKTLFTAQGEEIARAFVSVFNGVILSVGQVRHGM